jgi:hypothetical protein
MKQFFDSPLAGVFTVVLFCGMILGFFLYVGRLS